MKNQSISDCIINRSEAEIREKTAAEFADVSPRSYPETAPSYV
jgi:hypothetical protein